MKKWNKIFVLIILGMMWSCQNSPSPSEFKLEKEKEKRAAIVRNADRIIQQNGMEVGFYSYENLKPFLEAKNDTTYIINFWATWCAPCVKELPHFEKLYQKYKDQKVRLILVSLDFEKELKKKLLPFVAKHQLQGEVVVLSQKGMNAWIDKINPSWSGSLPATIIYNKKRKAFFEKTFTYQELERELMMIL